jgi:hypothetical protein
MQERIKKANKTYCEGHERKGVKICNWEKMAGWKSFLKGEITEDELCEQAKEELAQLNETFGKYLRNDDDIESSEAMAEGPFGEKAKIANRIYRQACVDSGQSLCFFKNFATWQQFVHGEIGEGEFYEKAREEISRIMAGSASEN